MLLHSVRKLATLYAAAHVLTFMLTGSPISGGGGGGQQTVTGQLESRQAGPLKESFTTHSGTSTNSNNTKSATDVAYFSSYPVRPALPSLGSALAKSGDRRIGGRIEYEQYKLLRQLVPTL